MIYDWEMWQQERRWDLYWAQVTIPMIWDIREGVTWQRVTLWRLRGNSKEIRGTPKRKHQGKTNKKDHSYPCK